MTALRRWVQHHLNALNVYAALCNCGVPCRWARGAARWWQGVAVTWLYPRGDGDGR